VAVAADPDRTDLRADLDRLDRSDRRRDAAREASGRSLGDALEAELATERTPHP
jgi:hypothetical protein